MNGYIELSLFKITNSDSSPLGENTKFYIGAAINNITKTVDRPLAVTVEKTFKLIILSDFLHSPKSNVQNDQYPRQEVIDSTASSGVISDITQYNKESTVSQLLSRKRDRPEQSVVVTATKTPYIICTHPSQAPIELF